MLIYFHDDEQREEKASMEPNSGCFQEPGWREATTGGKRQEGLTGCGSAECFYLI